MSLVGDGSSAGACRGSLPRPGECGRFGRRRIARVVRCSRRRRNAERRRIKHGRRKGPWAKVGDELEDEERCRRRPFCWSGRRWERCRPLYHLLLDSLEGRRNCSRVWLLQVFSRQDCCAKAP
ncbi:hypothetical protein CLOM_g22091 [Closterium sp. NIES-68]|nr:hypothetical protein CLOM_g22091 [Closterium sp. NIES-68]GJP63134.1 hypothetical protein CLOP_g20209 [Closterium sp. NIES-67]